MTTMQIPPDVAVALPVPRRPADLVGTLTALHRRT